MISITMMSHLRRLSPLWCLTAPPSPRGIGRATKGKRLYGQARRLTSPDLHILCRMCTVDNKAPQSNPFTQRIAKNKVPPPGGRWWRQPPKGVHFLARRAVVWFSSGEARLSGFRRQRRHLYWRPQGHRTSPAGTVSQPIGKPFYGQAKGLLWLTWRSYAGPPQYFIPPEGGALNPPVRRSRSQAEPLAPRVKGPAAPSTLAAKPRQPTGIPESTEPVPILTAPKALAHKMQKKRRFRAA